MRTLIIFLCLKNPTSFSIVILSILNNRSMKKIVFTLNLCLLVIIMMAQVPAGFSYQAVVRNSSDEIVAGKTVKF